MSMSWLWDPHAVAKFQRFCGKERIPIEVATGNGKSVQVAGTDTRNGSASASGHGLRRSTRHGDSSTSTENDASTIRSNGHANASNGHSVDVQSNGNGRNGTVSPSANCSHTADDATQQDTQQPKTKIIHKYPVVKAIFHMASMVGEEEFFIAFLPIMFWNFDFFVGRRVVLLWFFTMYLGTALKDKIQWERPDPAIVLREANDEHCQEFGMPSTHTTSGAILAWGLIYVSYFRYEFSLLPATLVVLPMVLCMGISRVYSGHHTPLDVLGAFSLVACIMLAGSVLLEPLDSLYMTPSLIGPISALVTGYLGILLYPHPAVIRSSSKDMPTIIAVFLGFYIGLWMSVGTLNPLDNRHLEPFQLPSPDRHEVCSL
eukprot:scpid72671/ scgid2597/ Sphingosine-1-phosphate phosphatase 1; Sphingosine-1-phosphatase 1